MDQSVNYLPHKHEDLSLCPQRSHKKLSMLPSAEEAEIGDDKFYFHALSAVSLQTFPHYLILQGLNYSTSDRYFTTLYHRKLTVSKSCPVIPPSPG